MVKTLKSEGTELATLLLVDDSPADQLTVERALEDGSVNCRLLTVDNGEKALALLRGEAPYDDRERYPKPDLVLMDINMPIMDGKAAIREIRSDEKLSNMPVIMLTTSDAERDVRESYEAGANAYLIKPVEHGDFIQVMQKMDQFWFHLVVLPKS